MVSRWWVSSPGIRTQLRRGARCGRIGRGRFRDLSPRILAYRTIGLWRPAWLGRNPYSKSAAAPVPPWARCSQRGSSFRKASRAWPGSRWPPYSPSRCWRKSAPGISVSTSSVRPGRGAPAAVSPVSQRRVIVSISILVLLLFSKYFYTARHQQLFQLLFDRKFHISVRAAQLHLALFLLAMALGTLFGGPLGDRIGRKRVIWFSILGIAPFTLMLPHVELAWVGVLTFIIGLILSSAFSAIVVFAQELMPGNVGAGVGPVLRFRLPASAASVPRSWAAWPTSAASNMSIGFAPTCRC